MGEFEGVRGFKKGQPRLDLPRYPLYTPLRRDGRMYVDILVVGSSRSSGGCDDESGGEAVEEVKVVSVLGIT